jgi:hypothetical protein
MMTPHQDPLVRRRVDDLVGARGARRVDGKPS